MKKLLISFLLFFNVLLAYSQQTSIYANNMEYVLGDVKQAFIQDKISTKAQVDNLIIGFKNLKVNGIRIPIFAKGLEPNKAMLDYFYQQAKANGFKIFANPAQSSGGKRVANGVLNDDTAGGPVENDPVKTQNLINRIKEFALEYPCDWICPFNEDSRPDGTWSSAQFNTIFSQLYNNVNGAQLVGACQWGLEAAIETFDKTQIDRYISIATSHNLGFNHALWPSFIQKARAKGLKVWDSEVNHNKKYEDRLTRLETALENKVDGLVIYNSWSGINLSNGKLNNTDKLLDQQALFLNPNTSIDINSSNSEVILFPNPASNMVYITGLDDKSTVLFSDLQGKKILEFRNQNEFDISRLMNGLYLVQIINSTTAIKVFKLHVTH